ncbi:hypothetical protein [Marinomonas lutimaris]|uniref:hypothetical protein n=1 Tax=Marinomonas lutimaris TaxID=2846746 RepID=UPI001CA5D0EB|nr:hypothetical protein [Marinomonas lutimaris]
MNTEGSSSMEAYEYGIYCRLEDEKKLVQNINQFLVSLNYRKMYKTEPRAIRDPDNPEGEKRYAYCYRQFMKEVPRWYFDIYPNQDLDGQSRFPDYLDIAWTLYVRKTDHVKNSAEDRIYLDDFFSRLSSSCGFPVQLLHSYFEGENRK